MRILAEIDPNTFRDVRFVLTDMDDTLTYRGRLAADTYATLERLQAAGIKVIPVTAAPAGWCDQMSRMWPVDGVIGENGGLFFTRNHSTYGLTRLFWHEDETRLAAHDRLLKIGQHIRETLLAAEYAEDQPYRLTSIAFKRPADREDTDAIAIALRRAGADAAVNNLWVLGWLGGYDKLAMSERVLSHCFGLDICRERHSVLYVGDSTNDSPMFEFFPHSVGVNTVAQYMTELHKLPSWITSGPGGAGFVEAADAVIRAQCRT